MAGYENARLVPDGEALAARADMRGSNQAGVRAHNERLVLSLIRRHGALAKSEIARLSGLSPQTATVLIRGLEADGLVLKGERRRGRVGQPSVPMRLAPGGAFSLGLKIGRRTSEMVLTDFSGRILDRRAIFYAYPRRVAVIDFAAMAFAELVHPLSDAERERIAGLGVGMPSELWSWGEAVQAPSRESEDWRREGIADELERVCGTTIFMANDVTAACGAEQAFGTSGLGDYLYFFVGAFVGGGIVIDGRLVPGRRGNAGALGSLRVPDEKGGDCQLIDAASIHLLEKAAQAHGLDGADLWRGDADWGTLGTLLDAWIARAARGLAHAVTSASAVYDFEAALLDGSFSPAVRARLVEETAQALRAIDRRGLSPIAIGPGTIGREAREIGAASLPFFTRFFLDHRVLYTGG